MVADGMYEKTWIDENNEARRDILARWVHHPMVENITI